MSRRPPAQNTPLLLSVVSLQMKKEALLTHHPDGTKSAQIGCAGSSGSSHLLKSSSKEQQRGRSKPLFFLIFTNLIYLGGGSRGGEGGDKAQSQYM
jgi:hypothetical protein